MTNSNTQDHSNAFYVNWANGFAQMGIDPMFPMKACMNESGCLAQAWNKVSNTVGLIQFTPETLKYIGFPGDYNAMKALTAEQQVPWVLKFYQKAGPKNIKSAALAYTATYLPSLVKEASESPLGEAFILCQDKDHGGKLSWAYDANHGFDHGKKGYITVGDLQQTIDASCKGPRWDEISARLQDAIDGKTPLIPPQRVAGVPPATNPTVSTNSGIEPSPSTSPLVSSNVLWVGGTALLLGYLGYRYIKANPPGVAE
jgi:hypothetical protein